MNPFSALGNLIGSLFNTLGDGIAFLTGGLEARRKKMGRNSHIIDQKFKNIKARKLKGADDLLQAIAELEIAKEDLSKQIRDEAIVLGNADENRQGAAALAKERAEALGGDRDKAMSDDEYKDHRAAYDRYNEEYEDSKKRLDGDGTEMNIGLRAELISMTDQIETYDRDLKAITKDAKDVDKKKAKIVADIRIGEVKERAARTQAGLDLNAEDKDLEEMERLGVEARARSSVAGRLAGSSQTAQDAKYKQAARRSTTGDSFDAMMGFKEKDKPATEAPAKLPEN